jgi:hypothetical protein
MEMREFMVAAGFCRMGTETFAEVRTFGWRKLEAAIQAE